MNNLQMKMITGRLNQQAHPLHPPPHGSQLLQPEPTLRRQMAFVTKAPLSSHHRHSETTGLTSNLQTLVTGQRPVAAVTL